MHSSTFVANKGKVIYSCYHELIYYIKIGNKSKEKAQRKGVSTLGLNQNYFITVSHDV